MLAMMDAAEFESWRTALTAHCARVGLTRDMFANGQDLAGIMHAPRWKSPAQPARCAGVERGGEAGGQIVTAIMACFRAPLWPAMPLSEQPHECRAV